jgi:hypothetical protein
MGKAGRPKGTIDKRLVERNQDILQRREWGETLESIGVIYGLTRERVRQIEKATNTAFGDAGLRPTDVEGGGPMPEEVSHADQPLCKCGHEWGYHSADRCAMCSYDPVQPEMGCDGYTPPSDSPAAPPKGREWQNDFPQWECQHCHRRELGGMGKPTICATCGWNLWEQTEPPAPPAPASAREWYQQSYDGDVQCEIGKLNAAFEFADAYALAFSRTRCFVPEHDTVGDAKFVIAQQEERVSDIEYALSKFMRDYVSTYVAERNRELAPHQVPLNIPLLCEGLARACSARFAVEEKKPRWTVHRAALGDELRRDGEYVGNVLPEYTELLLEIAAWLNSKEPR